VTARRPIRAASVAGARMRGSHTLAPEHLGDASAAATVAVIVGGVALVITGIGVIALALTIGARFGAEPPPNAGALAVGPIIGGVAAILLGGALAAGGMAVLANVPRSRLVTGIVSAVAAALAALGTVLAMANAPADPVLAIALTVATLIFGVASVLLLRPRR
jgi:hypothetical protein